MARVDGGGWVCHAARGALRTETKRPRAASRTPAPIVASKIWICACGRFEGRCIQTVAKVQNEAVRGVPVHRARGSVRRPWPSNLTGTCPWHARLTRTCPWHALLACTVRAGRALATARTCPARRRVVHARRGDVDIRARHRTRASPDCLQAGRDRDGLSTAAHAGFYDRRGGHRRRVVGIARVPHSLARTRAV